MLNVLYGILTNGESAVAPYEWYGKQCDNPVHTAKIDAIRQILLTGVPAEKTNFFACVVCDLVRHSEFGNEIFVMDYNNTYNPPGRPLLSSHDDDYYTFHELCLPTQAFLGLKLYLDEDITARLSGLIWLDYIAAGCLQILREVYK